MTITNSEFANQILFFVQNQLGKIFFFNHIAVVELDEGVHFSLDNANLITDELTKYFGKKPFGVVANRINSYSVDLLDTPRYKEKVEYLKAYGVVGHNPAAKMNAEIENGFCKASKVDFDSLNEAVYQVYNKVKSHIFY
ncbi:MAG: hypothetical protein ACON5F_05695 [Jejuia sp.]